MKYIYFLSLLSTLTFADIFTMNSFEANFTQTIINEKKNVLEYSGHILAMKPQYAFWSYTKPSTKLIYINKNRVTIIEPELEQVIIKNIHKNIDFFKIIKNAKKINKDTYTTTFQSTKYTIKIEKSQLKSIHYQDQLDNKIVIEFTNLTINKTITPEVFTPSIPVEYDLIQG